MNKANFALVVSKINPKDTTRATVYELWTKVPNSMATFF